MADQDAKLARNWVEVSEEGADGTMVFRPADQPIPPTRGARRRLDLSASGKAEVKRAGPVDAYVTEGAGAWQRLGQRLQITLPGWEGDYDISELTDDRLVLKKR